MTTQTPTSGLLATRPVPLPFAPSLHIRAFVVPRETGNVLVYASPAVKDELGELPAIARQYLGHGHEAGFGAGDAGAPLFVHQDDRRSTERVAHVRASFTRRHTIDGDFEAIPIPGHTPGSTAYLWDDGDRRTLFTADTIYLDRGEWVAAVLESSDRERYLESLALLREIEFDVLVPWAATAGQPFYALTDSEDAQRRIDAIVERIEAGGDR